MAAGLSPLPTTQPMVIAGPIAPAMGTINAQRFISSFQRWWKEARIARRLALIAPSCPLQLAGLLRPTLAEGEDGDAARHEDDAEAGERQQRPLEVDDALAVHQRRPDAVEDV